MVIFQPPNNGLVSGSNTGTARIINDPASGSTHGKILETFCLTPSSDVKVDLRKWLNVNNVGSAFDVQFDFKIPQATYDAMTASNSYVEMATIAPGGNNDTSLAVKIRNKSIILTSGAPEATVTSFPNNAKLTDWNTFRIRFTTGNSGTVYMNGTKIGTFLRAHASGTLANFGFIIKSVFTANEVDKAFYFDNFTITEAPVFSANFENVAVLDTDIRADSTIANEIYYGTSVAQRWTPDKFSMSVLRPNSYQGAQNPAGNTLDAVITNIGGTHGNVLKFSAGPMVGVTYDTGEVDGEGEPVMSTTTRGEPILGKQLQMPNPGYSTTVPLTVTVKFSVYIGEGAEGASIKIADAINASIPSVRRSVWAIKDGKIYSGTDANTVYGVVEKDEDGWSDYILTINLSDLNKPAVDCVQNGKTVFENVEFTHPFNETWDLVNSIYYIFFGGGLLSANQYTYFDDIVIEGGYNDVKYGSNGVYAWDGSAVSGDALTVLTNGTFVGKTSVKNNSYGSRSVNLVAALYENGKLESVETKSIIVPAGTVNYADYVSAPVSGSAGKYMKVFLWDDLNRLIPLNTAGGTNQ